MVKIDLEGDISLVISLGDIDILDNINNFENKYVYVELPILESETALTHYELLRHLSHNGADIAMNPSVADFSKMTDREIAISDIGQKTYFKLDPKGVEAAAATTVSMTKSASMGPRKDADFIANEPFKYAIFCQGELGAKECLFYGQIVE